MNGQHHGPSTSGPNSADPYGNPYAGDPYLTPPGGPGSDLAASSPSPQAYAPQAYAPQPYAAQPPTGHYPAGGYYAGGYGAGYYAPEPTTNGLAIASLVTSLLGAFVSFFAPAIASIVGVVLGHVALGQIRRTGQRGRGLAIAGLVIGYAILAITAVLFLLFALVLFTY